MPASSSPKTVGELARARAKHWYLKARRLLLRRAARMDHVQVWKAGLPEEAPYWELFLIGRGLEWRAEFDRMIDPDGLVVDPLITSILDGSPKTQLSILDVGAGPLSVVGRRYPGKELSIVAIDPLASEYDELLTKTNITPPIRTRPGTAEHILEQFPKGSFDIAYARNSLDHSYDPVAAIRNMIAVVATDGKVLLRHKANEAENIHYFSLHQWNFDIDGTHFIIWSRGEEYDVNAVLGDHVMISCARDGEWVTCTISKRS